MKREHGTIQSYIIGFILSLVFTLIPYYLVVNQIVTGTTLFITIITFALLQAVIQIVFFLHLGRERNPRWQTGFLAVTVGGLFVVTVGTTWILYHLHENMAPTAEALKAAEDEGIAQVGGKATGACEGAFVVHKLSIKDGVASPSRIDAAKCDRLEFTDEDSGEHVIIFGAPGQPETYGGEDNLTLYQGYPQTLILNQPGTHLFSDKQHPETAGNFSVAP